MPVYVFREGTSNIFKIGRAREIESRRRHLNSGSSQGLSLFGIVETDNESSCEKFFHDLLLTRRVARGGSVEFFHMDSEEHMRETIKKLGDMFASRENARRAVLQYENAKCNGVMLEPASSDLQLLTKLRIVEARLLENREESNKLNFERELIQIQLKQKIRESLGIRGVATWETKMGRKDLDENAFMAREPEHYEALIEEFPRIRIDRDAWRMKRPEEYESVRLAYFSAKEKREFCLMEGSL